jgi:hypothetical protein
MVQVERSRSAAFSSQLQAHLISTFNKPMNVRRIDFDRLDVESIPPKSTVVSTIEYEDLVLSNATEDVFSRIKVLTNNATTLLWITTGGILKAKDPVASVILGIARVVSLEQPALKFGVLDIELQPGHNSSADLLNISQILQEMWQEPHPDLEYLQHDEALYCSRFLPESFMNRTFNQQETSQAIPTRLQDARRCRLEIEEPGQLSSIHFQQLPDDEPEVPTGYLEIQVKCVGVNQKVCREHPSDNLKLTIYRTFLL